MYGASYYLTNLPRTMIRGGYCAQPPRSKSHGTQAGPSFWRGTVHAQGVKSWGGGFIWGVFCLGHLSHGSYITVRGQRVLHLGVGVTAANLDSQHALGARRDPLI